MKNLVIKLIYFELLLGHVAIGALGTAKLSNVMPGEYHGPAAEWDVLRQQELGTYLLHRSFKIFLNEGEKQIRPEDLGRYTTGSQYPDL